VVVASGQRCDDSGHTPPLLIQWKMTEFYDKIPTEALAKSFETELRMRLRT
jgi:hypothetical protein